MSIINYTSFCVKKVDILVHVSLTALEAVHQKKLFISKKIPHQQLKLSGSIFQETYKFSNRNILSLLGALPRTKETKLISKSSKISVDWNYFVTT